MASLEKKAPLSRSSSLSVELGWAAGFLEGEGHFAAHRNSPVVTAVQKEREPLDRLHAVFGGAMSAYTRNDGRSYYRWQACGQRGAACMMTLYALLSSRRQARIEDALQRFKMGAVRSRSISAFGICPIGGAAHRIATKPTGRKYCADCNIGYVRRHRARKAKESSHRI